MLNICILLILNTFSKIRYPFTMTRSATEKEDLLRQMVKTFHNSALKTTLDVESLNECDRC